MQWKDIGTFRPEEHGTDALILKVSHGHPYTSTHYGWYDPDASDAFPWRFIDDHGDVDGDFDIIAVNGAPSFGTVVAFIPFSNLPR